MSFTSKSTLFVPPLKQYAKKKYPPDPPEVRELSMSLAERVKEQGVLIKTLQEQVNELRSALLEVLEQAK